VTILRRSMHLLCETQRSLCIHTFIVYSYIYIYAESRMHTFIIYSYVYIYADSRMHTFIVYSCINIYAASRVHTFVVFIYVIYTFTLDILYVCVYI